MALAWHEKKKFIPRNLKWADIILNTCFQIRLSFSLLSTFISLYPFMTGLPFPCNKILCLFFFKLWKYDACTIQCMFTLDNGAIVHANKLTDCLHVLIDHKPPAGISQCTPVGGASAFSKIL